MDFDAITDYLPFHLQEPNLNSLRWLSNKSYGTFKSHKTCELKSSENLDSDKNIMTDIFHSIYCLSP